jgi:peptidoglycan/LPS O-acetylase OafA/YrhL
LYNKYRPEIDGLRALAVIPVILYHADSSTLTGGFLGVDIFFVIIGYLITGIISEEMEDWSFSIVRFYERRARRILPALYLVIIACLPFAWAWLLPDELGDFAKSVNSVVLFWSNIFFNRTIDYFHHDTTTIPLIHTWSLAVEEQFYAFFPLLLLLLARLRFQRLRLAIALLSLLSLGASELTARVDAQSDFYLLPTRAWELGVGALVALTPQISTWLPKRAAEAAAFVGLAAIAYAIVAFNQDMPLPGLLSLAPVGGTALLIAFATDRTVCGRLLAFRPLVGVGLLSYSAYLWHQPLLAFARIRGDAIQPGVQLILLFGATFALSYVSWRFVERPFRDRKRLSTRLVAIYALAVGVSLVIAAHATHVEGGFPGRWSAEFAEASAMRTKWQSLIDRCLSSDQTFIPPQDACVFGAPVPARIALLGDSHAASIAEELGDQLRAQQQSVKTLAFAGCLPARGLRETDPRFRRCPEYNDLAFAYVESHPEIETVVVMARWSAYFDGPAYSNGEGAVMKESANFAVPVAEPDSFVDNKDRMSRVGAAIRAEVEELINSGRNVVVVYPVPEIGFAAPDRVLQFAVFHPGAIRAPVSISLESYLRRSRNAREQLDLLPESAKALRVRPEVTFCDTTGARRCAVEAGGKPLYIDDNHLNGVGSALLSRQIVEAMKRQGWL